MRIPHSTVKGRYYVATDHSTAFSSWDSLEEAYASFERLREHYPDDANDVIGVVKIGPGNTTTWYPKEANGPR